MNYIPASKFTFAFCCAHSDNNIQEPILNQYQKSTQLTWLRKALWIRRLCMKKHLFGTLFKALYWELFGRKGTLLGTFKSARTFLCTFLSTKFCTFFSNFFGTLFKALNWELLAGKGTLSRTILGTFKSDRTFLSTFLSNFLALF